MSKEERGTSMAGDGSEVEVWLVARLRDPLGALFA
jgi:hypothetical protein